MHNSSSMGTNALLYHREQGRKISTSKIATLSITQLPRTLKETNLNVHDCDKVFSSFWLNHTDVLFGTKCQKLQVYNVLNQKMFDIPLFDPVTSTPHAQRCSKGDTGSCASSMHFYPTVGSNPATNMNGIRAISANPSHTLIAIACSNPYHIFILDLPTLSLKSLLQGHIDTIFSVDWADDRTVVSGSRDGTMKCWRLLRKYAQTIKHQTEREIDIFKPVWSVVDNQEQRIRDLRHMDGKAATLSSEGVVDVWDLDTQMAIRSVPVPYPLESVCMANNDKCGILAIGSQAHISIIDPRSGLPVHTFPSINEYSGVRSLEFTESVITTGGGLGRIGWYDLRAHEYINLGEQDFYSTNPGWLDKENELYPGSVAERGLHINAVFTLSYSPHRTKLFTAGGPLQANLKGSYAGVWM